LIEELMKTRTIRLAHAVLLLGCLVAPVYAQQSEEALKKDLTAVIALQGKPCGEVVSARVLKENDYAATCKDGNKYHVYENDKGRVVVEKQ
jgi:hypothetical protein